MLVLGHSGGCSGTAEYYRSTPESVLVQQSTTGALGRLCWYSRVLQKHWGGGVAVLVQQNTIEALGKLCGYSKILSEHSGGWAGTAKYYRNHREALLLEQSTIGGLRRLYWYSIVL